MTTDSRTASAKIYEFPVRIRAAARIPGGAASGEPARPVADVAPSRISRTTFGSGWYHEAAIQEAERTVKR
jgi:hypothetical protein